MRLFIALNFDEKMKNWIAAISEQLRMMTVRGTFSQRDNFHLTLVFLGDQRPSSVVKIKEAMNTIEMGKVDLTIGGIGRFRRNGGDIYWMGVEKTMHLETIYNTLCTELKHFGFDIDERPFQPHLTLARQVVVKKEFDRDAFSAAIEKKRYTIGRVSLMLSERVNGKLTYTEIYGKDL